MDDGTEAFGQEPTRKGREAGAPVDYNFRFDAVLRYQDEIVEGVLLTLQLSAATMAVGLLIGRAAQGRPWIFAEISHYLASGEHLPAPSAAAVGEILISHLEALYAFYGEDRGVRIARKHLGWYARDRAENVGFRQVVNRAQSAEQQLALTRDYFAALSAAVDPARILPPDARIGLSPPQRLQAEIA